MESRRWINQSQPQTLYIAVFLLYVNAAFLIFDLLAARALPLLWVGFAAGQVAAGYGIANERKWGYYLGVAMSLFPFALRLYVGLGLFSGNPLSLLFEIALVALLLHPQSREHQRIWFK